MKKYLLIPLLILLANCASYKPLYDPKASKDGGKNFYADLEYCEKLVLREEGFFDADRRIPRINKCMSGHAYSILD